MDMIRSMGGVPEGYLNCCLTCKVCNDYCGLYTGGYSRVWLPDQKLIDRYYVSQDWYETEFIMGFSLLSIHDTHTSQPLHPTDHKVMPVITMYPNSVIHKKTFDVVNTTHFVSVVFAKQHFAVLYYDLAGRTVSVFDGLDMDVKTWSQHISHTLWTYGLVSMAKNPTSNETKRYYQKDGRQRDGVQDRRIQKLTLEYQSLSGEDSSTTCIWTVCNEASYTQQDGFNCGPLACLKLMEINGRVAKGTIDSIISGGSKKTIRWEVMEYFEECIERYNDDLKVDIRAVTAKKIEEQSSIAKAVIKDGDVDGVEIDDAADVHAKAVIEDGDVAGVKIDDAAGGMGYAGKDNNNNAAPTPEALGGKTDRRLSFSLNDGLSEDKWVVPTLPSMDVISTMTTLQLEEAEIDDAAWDDFNDHGDEEDDSDEDGDECLLHSDAVNVKAILTTGATFGEDEDSIDEEGVNCSELPLSWIESCRSLRGSPVGWKPPQPSDKWSSYSINDKKNDAPNEEDIDNPGNWHHFAFRPKYDATKKKDGGGKYINHFTPAGAIVKEQDKNGERIVEGWKLHYNGWHANEFNASTYVRGTAAKGDLKPSSRKGSLDVATLLSHGFNADRVKNDPFLFFQMLFPIAMSKTTSIPDDNRMPFFSLMTWFTHIYAAEKGAGMGLGHKWVAPDIAEMVRWTAVPIRHGALDGKPGSLSCRWKQSDPRYDEIIAISMTYSRFIQLKRYMKLNNNSSEPKRGTNDYNPCSKYDMIFKVLVHNMNYVTKYADLDPSMDESTWGFGGYMGEAGWRLINKPFPKGEMTNDYLNSIMRTTTTQLCIFIIAGGQTCMLYDITRRYPRGYKHRHKLTQRPEGFNAEGPAEVVGMVTEIERLMHKDEYKEVAVLKDGGGAIHEYKMKPIYFQKPHITFDNYFSGDKVMDYIGRKGFGVTCTVRRDRYPAGLKPYLHHDVVKATDMKTKVMRFGNPIVAIKEVPAIEENKDEGIEKAEAYTKTLVSFQSTGATNIGGVNNLSSCELYVRKKDRGRKDNKYVWAIEQNDARELYLGHYFGIDSADHMIKNAQIKFTSWRYWHAPYLHALAMGVLAAYDMYNECCDGELEPSWKIETQNRMSFVVFRQQLSQQMLEYNPANLKYSGDEMSRSNTQINKKRKESRNDDKHRKMVKYNEGGMTVTNYQTAMTMKRFDHGNDLHKLNVHLRNMVKKSNKMICEVCGEKTYWKCVLCNSALCTTDGKRKWNGGRCMLSFHNPSFWGLARSDSHLHNITEAAWVAPKEQTRKRNGDSVASLKASLEKGNK